MRKEGFRNEPWILVSGDVYLRHCSDGNSVLFLHRLRENIREEVMLIMIYVTAAVAVFLFVYLVVALVRPEWF
jgi:K+-transporting ATPase KdpF subunit